MNNVILTESKFKDADFRGSNLEGLQINLNQLKGAIIDIPQSVYLLQRYANVTVKAADDETEHNSTQLN